VAPLLRVVTRMQIRNNEAESRFEYEADGKLAFVEYKMAPHRIILVHTEVPPELSNRGIAQELARTALDHARQNKLHVVPLCSYIAAYIKRNPEYSDLISN
jgi:predicted GNAT family acetyltransferase